MSLTIQKKLRRFPPAICRLLARRAVGRTSVVAMTDREIAAASQLSMADVKSLSITFSWDDVPVRKLVAFTRGCGINLDDSAALKKHEVLKKKGTFTYLRRSREWESLFLPIIKELQGAS